MLILPNIVNIDWLTDALKKNTKLEELDLQTNFLWHRDFNMYGIREAADQPDNPLKILDLQNQAWDTDTNKKITKMKIIIPYEPKRSTLTILL